MKQEDIDKDVFLDMVRRFKNHADVHGWPSESFRKKVKKYLKMAKNKEDGKVGQ